MSDGNINNFTLERAETALLSRDFALAARLYKSVLKDDENNEIINSLVEGTSVEKVSINTLSTLTDEERNNYDYISLMTENLEKIKKELYN